MGLIARLYVFRHLAVISSIFVFLVKVEQISLFWRPAILIHVMVTIPNHLRLGVVCVWWWNIIDKDLLILRQAVGRRERLPPTKILVFA